MAVLAQASSSRLVELYDFAGLPSEALDIRAPETGLVTVRGRMGGGGGAFNVGEITVTRASLRSADGVVGHSYCLGTDRKKARIAALVDAHWQNPDRRDLVEQVIIAPLEAEQQQLDEKRIGETAATRVDFFTMVRGED
ncbi:protein phnG [Limoniibacter endophyticus]|uniref:Protein phnG n=2 Tax=Limoniibacter endophyticus TaxID=1565040 RepID=A0A8J3DM93_9HYPH|nr:protein phnG [Limoniibacter endophyticus]